MGAALAFTPLTLHSHYWLGIVTTGYLMAGLAGAWNIIGGFGGQFSLGHGIFFAIGAYLTAILYTQAGISPWVTILPASLIAALVAVGISWLTFRLRGPFFVIATMALSQVFLVLVNYLDWPTGGPQGILIPFHPSLKNMILRERWKWTLMMFVFLAIVVAISIVIRRSRFGFYLLASREDDESARAAGVDVVSVRSRGMALSAMLTSIGGSLFAMYFRYIDPPSVLGLAEVGVKFALLSLIGGLGTIPGPVLGAALIVPLENYLRVKLGGSWPGIHLAILGAIMLLAALFMKRGIVGVGEYVLARRRYRNRIPPP
jgi:branched-chain amino acid transport system permease protein